MIIQYVLSGTLILVVAIAPVTAQTLGLEQVIRAVCANSDSVKMMRETVIKSDEMVREKWSNALPRISSTLYTGKGRQGLGGGASGGGSSSSASLAKTAKTSVLDPQEIATVQGVVGGTLQNLFSDPSLFTDMTPYPITMYSASVSVTQTIFTFGKIGTAISIASQFNKSVKSSFDRNLEQLQLLGLDAFYRVVLSEMALNIARRSLDRKKELSEFLTRNFQLGSGNKAQILATQADLKGQVPVIIKAEQDLAYAKMGLNLLMGRSLTDPVQMDTASAALPGLVSRPVPPESSAVQTALGGRGDLQALDYMARATLGGKKIFNAMYLPSIAATGSFGSGGKKFEYLTEWDRRTWMVGVGLQWTFFDGFASNAKARQYASDARKLEVAKEGLIKMIQIEVSMARLECGAADSNLSATQEMLAAARESYNLTSDNFKQGSGQFADLQLAEERLRLAEMGSESARYRQVRSRAALQVALGRDIVSLTTEEK